MSYKSIVKFVFILSLSGLIGCANVVRNAKNPENASTENLSVIATLVNGDGDAVIGQIDEETFVGTWKVLVPPGRHTITLKQVGFDRPARLTKTYQIDILPKKHYDILFSGDGYMRERDPALDSRFIGGAKRNYDPLVVIYRGTDKQEIVTQSFIDKNAREAQLRREQYQKEHSSEIAAQNARYEAMRKARAVEESRQAEENAKLVKQRGQKVCRSMGGTFSTFMPIRTIIGVRDLESQNDALYYLTAITEGNAGSQIQIRVSSIYRLDGSREVYVDKLDGETVYKTSQLAWVNAKDWRPCR